MKISAISEAKRFIDTVRGKRERQEHPHQQQQQGGSNPGQQQGQQDEHQATFEEVRKAVDDFRADAQAAKNGLQAEVSGQGPGLRVTLQDERGNVIRQLTGDEFLRLREAAKVSEHPRGKILDQKL